jgi:hypothetical protein
VFTLPYSGTSRTGLVPRGRRYGAGQVAAPDVAEDVELADSVSMAMLLVLETLTPIERAVFVLREVFDLGYDEIAEAVDKSPAAVRQIAHRARAHVAARRPRGVVSAAETRAALEASGRPPKRAICILRLNGEIDTVMAVRIDDGLITGLYAVRNPEKLSHMDALRR